MTDQRNSGDPVPREPEGGPGKRREAFFEARLGREPDNVVLPSNYRSDLVRDYRRQVQDAAADRGENASARISAPPPGARRRVRLASPAAPGLNWIPIGPSVVRHGLVATLPPISGRVAALAVSADGRRLYAAAGNGGLWRSDDAGRTWYSLMNGFALHSPYDHSDSLSMGALAINSAQPDRIYVGSGEGEVDTQYFGVGPLSSDDGGLNWSTEKWDANAGNGSWFFELAMDPKDPEHLLGATAHGLLRRQPRNQNVAALNPLPHRPQSYLLQYNSNSGSPAVNYWTGEGTDTEVAWERGGAGWRWGLDFMPFTIQGEPWLLTYMPQGGRWPWSHNGGSFRVFWIDGTGTPQQRGAIGAAANWTTGLTLLPFTLGGETYFVRYDSGTGAATLARWNTNPANGTFVDLWTQPDWPGAGGGVAAGTRWEQLMPFRHKGASYFLAYLRKRALRNADEAMLYRWTGTLEAQPMWDSPRALGSRSYSLVPFELDGEPCFQAYDPGSGTSRILKWDVSGNFSEEATATYPTGLSLYPFQFVQRNDDSFGKESRFLGYNKSNGQTSLYHFPNGPQPSLLWKRTWGTNLQFVPFGMGYEWLDQQANGLPAPPNNKATSVVAATGQDATTFYAAFSGGSVYSWQPAVAGNWARVGPANGAVGGLPGAPGNISLAVQPSNPDVVYALLQDSSVYRFATNGPGAGLWQLIAGAPLQADMAGGQGDYDLKIAVAPDDVNRLYLGGATVLAPLPPLAAPPRVWSAALYRCEVTVAVGGAVTMNATYIGDSVHADIHALQFSPTNPKALWVGCDGGVFFSANPTGASVGVAPAVGPVNTQAPNLFTARNTGLSTITVNRMAQNTNQDAVAFIGTQDNCTDRFTGSAAWRRNGPNGDTGAVVIRHGNDQQVIANTNVEDYELSVDGGATFPAAGSVPLLGGDTVLFYPPMVGASGADRIGFGTQKPWFSDNFAGAWQSIPNNNAGDLLGARISAMAFTSDGLTLYVGLETGLLYKFVDAGGLAPNWGPAARIDNQGVAPGPLSAFLALPRPITSVAIDPADNDSIYVTLGGNMTVPPFVGPNFDHGWKRVWHFANAGGVVAGGVWSPVSGQPPPAPASSRLMNTQFNALAGRRVAGATHLYAGGDIGLWESKDGGAHWIPYANGLPESSVVDVGFFEPRNIVLANGTPATTPRILRAATHGRGIYERILPPDVAPVDPSVAARYERYKLPVQLYLRATPLDRGIYDVQTGGASALDPAHGNAPVHYWDGTGIKITNPTNLGPFPLPAGTPYTFNLDADASFEQFADLADDSGALHTTRRTRIYVEINNRGVAPADNVTVTLLLSRRLGALPFAAPPPPLPRLPANLPATLAAGTFVATRDWKTLAVTAHDDVLVGFPEIAVTDIADDRLRVAGIYCLVAIAHCPDDPFTSAERTVETLTLGDSKVIIKYLQVN